MLSKARRDLESVRMLMDGSGRGRRYLPPLDTGRESASGQQIAFFDVGTVGKRGEVILIFDDARDVQP